MVYSRWYCSICNIRGCVVRLRIFCALFDHGLGLRFGFGGHEWKHQSPVEFCSAKGRKQNAGPLLFVRAWLVFLLWILAWERRVQNFSLLSRVYGCHG